MAETLALEQALETCFAIKYFLCNILNREMNDKISPIKCLVDKVVKRIFFFNNLEIESLHICIVGEMIAKKEVISIEGYKSEFQFADYLTKGTSSGRKLPDVLKICIYFNNIKKKKRKEKLVFKNNLVNNGT